MKENKYMSKEYTNCMKGIFAILVVVHHLYQYTGLLSGTYMGAVLQLLGFVSVAMFFFFSGYGLMLSSKKQDYIKHFFRNRFLPLYCFYVLLIILYSLWTLLLEKTVSTRLIVQSFFFGGTVVTNAWYMQTTFVLYLIYWVVFKFIKSSKIQVLLFGLAVVAYCLSCYFGGLYINWYQTVPCMVLGMVYYYKKDWIDARLKKHSWIIFIANCVLFAGCYVLSKISGISVIFDVLYSLFFVCAAISLAYILCNTPIINNPFFSLCGKYSLEIYLTHGFFLRLITLNYVSNKLIFILVVLFGTVIMSAIMRIVYIKIVSLFTKREQQKPC